MAEALRVLMIEDDARDADLIIRELRNAGFEPKLQRVESEAEFLELLDESLDIILSDYRLPRFNAVRALELVKKSGFNIPFILISGAIGEETAVAMIKDGATDYLLKDRMGRLGNAIRHAVSERLLRIQNQCALQALEENEARYRSLVQVMSHMVWIANERGETLSGSTGWHSFTGKKSDVGGGWNWTESIHPEDRERVLQTWKHALATRTLYEADYRVKGSDGTYGHFYARGVPVFNENGTVREWVGTCTDFTKRKQAELRNVAFSKLGQQLNLATKPKDAAQIIVQIADELFGWDSCYLHLYSLREKKVRKLLAIDVIDGKRTALPTIESDKPSSRMQQVIDHGGQLILRDNPAQNLPDALPFGSKQPSASIMIVPIRSNTEVIGLLSIQSYTSNAFNQQDLETLQSLADYCGGALERIRAEERITYQAHLLANVTDAIIATDASHTLTSWNHAAEEMYGWAADEALGKTIQEVIRSELGAEQEREICHALANEGRCVIEVKQFRRDGQPIFVEGTTIALRDENGNVMGYASVNREVTKRRHLEEQLRQAQKMEAFGQLAGGVAHDFNNILTIIGGYTNLLLSSDSLQGEAKEDLALIAGAAEKASNLTRQLLTFSRKKEMQVTLVMLNDVASNITKMLQRIIGEDVRLQLNYAPNLPLISGDITMLEQILLNLAVNARDAMPSGGELYISTEEVSVTNTPTNPEARVGNFVCLTVRDTGTGIPLEVRERIFEPFFTTKGRKGTGLGLATVYGIVKQHRGWIEVSSEMDVGTTFKIFLPVNTSSTPSMAIVRKDADVNGGTETILLVEDEVGVRGLARQILQRHGYRVVEAESGAEALKIWDQHKNDISLVVTDMVMPGGVNGRELAIRLEEKRPGLKVIYTSGYSVNLNELKLQEGWNFLQKPYPPKKLAKAVRDRLDGNKTAMAR